MAIYKNREVQILDYGHQRSLADTITVQNAAGALEVVPVGALRYTKDEIQKLNEHTDLAYENLQVASDEDIKAVRLGVAPSYSPDRIEKAKADVVTDEARKMDQKLTEDAKSEANKDKDQVIKQAKK